MVRSAGRAAIVAAALASLVAATVVDPYVAGVARADVTTVSYDPLRTGWDPNEPGLSPATVGAPDFGQLFATQLTGQIYAQPLVANGTLMAVTEANNAYGLDPVTGAVRWTRNVGASWSPSKLGCGDLVPEVGITATPVYDGATGTAYFTAKVNDQNNLDHPHWYMHAVDVRTGAERAGWPMIISGAPTNDPAHPFNAVTAMQRPGLLLLGGVVYAAFASHCDYGPYVGYVVGVKADTGKQATMWSTEAGSSYAQAGIWQSGGGIVSDGPNSLIVTTGNGVAPPPGPGTTPPSTLGETVIRLGVKPDGSLQATDFFSPSDNSYLNRDDTDLGAGGPVALPAQFGTPAHPRLLVQVGKDGRVFLLDRDNLGGSAQGAGGGDAVLQTIGPFRGVWGHPGVWGGDGGYVYTIENQGYLRAYKYGVSGSGLPSFTPVGTSAGTWGYTSGSPVITSNGTASGSALVWGVYAGAANGSGGQLRAYDVTPTNGVLALRYSAPIGTAAKFASVATDKGRVYTGTRDGVVYGFGRPTTSALAGSPTDFGSVAVGSSATRTVTLTATRTVQVTGVGTSGPFTAAAQGLPRTLQTGQTLTVQAGFTPTVAGSASASLTVTTDAGALGFDLHGLGTAPGLKSDPGSLAFADVPLGGTVTLNLDIRNTGTTAATITGVTLPAAPFVAGSPPKVGAVLAPSTSVTVPVTFTPTAAGAVTSSLTVTSDQGGVTVPLTGSGVSGSSHLSLSPMGLDFGQVPIGTTVTRTFDVANTGNLTLTISKAAPPAAPFGATTPLSEGQQLTEGQLIHQTVSFTPTGVGLATGQYLITGSDGKGAQSVWVSGVGVPPGPVDASWQLNGSATRSGSDVVLTPAVGGKAGSVVYPSAVPSAGLHVSFTAQISGGTGADGLALALLDATSSTRTSLGRSGGALGFGGLKGVAVTLDTYKNYSEAASNVVGIATGASGTGSDSLAYAATLRAPTPLTSGTHVVDVQVSSTQVSVSLDGGPRLVSDVAVPPRILLAFSAGTGGLTDRHVVRDVAVTLGTPGSGPVTGTAGMCMDVLGRKTADGSPVGLVTCNATPAQFWTRGATDSLRGLGKCLTSAGYSGGAAFISTCDGSAAQRWVPDAQSRLVVGASTLCLAVPGTSTASGVPLQVRTCSADARQKWTLPAR